MDNLFQGKWINQLWIPLLGSLVSILYQLGHVARGFDHVLEGCKKQTHVALAPFEAAIKLNNLNYQCVLLVFMFPVPNRWREFRLWEKSKGREGYVRKVNSFQPGLTWSGNGPLAFFPIAVGGYVASGFICNRIIN